jgi:signal transduction histidine kinase
MAADGRRPSQLPAAERCERLEAQVRKLERINAALMDRVERGMDLQGSAFSLFQAATTLESEVRTRTAELRDALAALERTNHDLVVAKQNADDANRAKSEFLAKMSHEIRTPMNGVLGMAELLSTTALNPRQRRYVDTIQRSIHSLLGIVNTILDFSKIESGKLELDDVSFDLVAVLEDSAELLSERAAAKDLELVCDG